MKPWISLVIILLVTFLSLAGCKEDKPVETREVIRPVKVKRVQTAVAADQMKSFTGTAKGIKESILSFRVPGVLKTLTAKVGDQVKNGQAVATLDDRDFKLNVRDLENRLQGAEAQLDQLRKGARSEDVRILDSRIKGAQAAERAASADYRRVQQLYAKDAAPKSRLDQAQNQWEQAREAVRAAQEEKAKALAGGREEEIRAQTANIRSIRSNLSQAKANLTDTTLKIPFDGIISAKQISDFEQVGAGQPIYTLVDITRIEIQISIPEQLISQVTSGQSVEVHLPNFAGQSFVGTTTKLGVTADKATLTYPVFVELDNPENLILPGMSAEVQLQLEQQGSGFPSVPINSVLEDKVSKLKYVWIFDETSSSVSRRDVTLGRILSDDIEVIQGLQNGDLVVIAGVHRVQEGLKVRVPKNI